MNQLLNHPLFQAVAVMILTLLGNKIWQRWLSKSSRVTLEKCKDNQALCFQKVTAKITEVTATLDKLNGQLTCGDATFEKIEQHQERTTHTLKLILMTLAELCTSGDGCEDRTKERIRQEMMK